MAQFKLMQHQREGVKFLDSVDGIGALLYDPGVGKTGTALAWADKQAKIHGEFRVLVVAPLAASDTWVFQPVSFMDSLVKARMLQGPTINILNEIKKARNWADVPSTPISVDHVGKHLDRRVTILSLSAGALSSYCDDRIKRIRVLQAVRKYQPHLIIVDESHIIKSPTSNISVTMYAMGQLVPHRIILTGTVNPLSILDCYGQWRFLAPWTFSDQYGKKFTQSPLTMTNKQIASIKPWPWGRFRDRYSDRGGYAGKGFGGYRSDTEQEIKDRIAERSHVVRKADALDLPPVRDVDVHVQLSAKEMAAYRQMAEDLLTQLESGELLEAVNPLAKMMKLRQIAAGFIKDTDTDTIHTIGNSLWSTAKDLAETTLAGEQRLVVWGHFRHEVQALAKMLKRKGVMVHTISGKTKAKDRLAIRRAFADVSGNLDRDNKKRTILVAQQRTLSLSVNELVVAQNAIFTSQSDQRVDYVQSRDRLDRNGQKLPVTFWNCFTPGLIGEIIIARHQDRGSMQDALLDHIRSFGR